MRYKKKPVIVDAWRNIQGEPKPEWLRNSSFASFLDGNIYVDVPKGVIVCRPGHWIVREDNGDLAVYEPEAFAKTHEAVVEGSDGRTYAIPDETGLVEAMLRLSDEAAKANTAAIDATYRRGFNDGVRVVASALRRYTPTSEMVETVYRCLKP